MTVTVAFPTLFYPAAQELAVFDGDGPRPQILVDSADLKVLVVGLECGQQIPAHPEALAVYYVVEGDGVMTVDDQAYALAAGAIVVAPPGAARGVCAGNRLVFLAVKAGA